MSSPSAELAEALRGVVGGQVRCDSYTRRLFSRDASMYAIESIGVVFPRDAADVAAAARTVAHRHVGAQRAAEAVEVDAGGRDRRDLTSARMMSGS